MNAAGGWTPAFTVVGYGARVGVRVSDERLAAALWTRLPPGAQLEAPGGERAGRSDRVIALRANGDGRGPYEVLSDRRVVWGGADMAQALGVYDAALRQALALNARHRLFVHAGVVAWRGGAIVLPGRSLAGKTRLVAQLVKAGADYLSDECAVLDQRGQVHPFAKPLSMRDAQGRQSDVPVESLGGRAVRSALPVRLVLLTRFRNNSRWKPRRLTAGVGALEIMRHAMAARRRPELALRVLGEVALAAPVFKSLRPDAERVVGDILALAAG